ncbi:MAG TPA: DNA alkylation repair protein [Patescibacteria group bacterium]|nr:DNA alkylation repair protein [Patescibacteria group bacterium]
MKSEDVINELQRLSSSKRAKSSAWYFKTGIGQYGEGDQFIGVSVPEQRKVAIKFKALPLPEVVKLLHSPIHEHRLSALFILVNQYKSGDKVAKKLIASTYHKNRRFVNNWDLVDSSAPYILGDYLKTHSTNVLIRLANSKSMWDRRIAIISTFAFIKEERFDLTLNIANMLLKDKEDLIHKATGWALREVGKKDQKILKDFLNTNINKMPRTTLRYSIERLPIKDRKYYMSIKI